MSACGRLEAQFTVPSGGWTVAVTITAIGTYNVTVAANTYTPTSFLTALQTSLDAASGSDGAFAVSASFTDRTGTGLVTIAHATETFSATWTSTDMRDLLGFSGSLTPAALTFTGTSAMRGAWLPDCEIDTTYGGEAGHYEHDRSELVSPDGTVYALSYATSRRYLPEIRWALISRARARTAAETTTGQSYETWWRDTHGGLYSYFAAAPQVTVYDDSTTSNSIGTFRLTGRVDTSMAKAAAPWHGLWEITAAGYKVP